MARSVKYRSLASIALARLSEKELKAIHGFISDISASSFLELVRDIEDEIDNSIHLSLDNFLETSFVATSYQSLFHEIDRIRRKELRITVHRFAEMLATDLQRAPQVNREPIPSFDSRRGLQAWINKLVSTFGEQEIFHAVSRLKKININKPDSDWHLR